MSKINEMKEGAQVVAEIIKAAGDSPYVKEAGNELGKTAVTITKAINNALLPLAAVNYGFEKARKYFSENFKDDMEKKTAQIPLEAVIEPKASIAGPALQGLAFSHEEQGLKELYLNLLASAMDNRVADTVHPAFVEIIKQLTAEEALLIQGLITGAPIAEVRLTEGMQGWQILSRHLINYLDREKKPVENPRIQAMVDNWVRLGLLEVDYDKSYIGGDSYKWVNDHPEFKKLCEMHKGDGKMVTYQKGVIIPTAFGQKFAKLVGILPS